MQPRPSAGGRVLSSDSMRVRFDQAVPVPIRPHLAGHDVRTAAEEGFRTQVRLVVEAVKCGGAWQLYRSQFSDRT
jgi:hypothetical protein